VSLNPVCYAFFVDDLGCNIGEEFGLFVYGTNSPGLHVFAADGTVSNIDKGENIRIDCFTNQPGQVEFVNMFVSSTSNKAKNGP
jgi:hypothetical protein